MKANRLGTVWPWALAAAFALWALWPLFPRAEKTDRVREFGRIPVLLNGRVQPLDTLARNALRQIRGKQTAPVRLHFSVFDPAKRGQLMPATTWLLEVFFRPEVADTRKIFRVDHPELLSMLRLPSADPEKGEDGKHYSFSQLQPALEELEKQAQRSGEKEATQRTALERQVLKVYSAVLLYHRLKNSVQPEGVQDLAAEVAAYRSAIPSGRAALQAREAGKEFSRAEADRLLEYLQRYDSLSRAAYPLVLPPRDPASSRDAWENMGAGLLAAARGEELHPAIEQYAAIATAYRNQNANEFNRAVAGYRAWLAKNFGPELDKARAEMMFNETAPFYRALVIYLLAFLGICGFWVQPWPSLLRAGTLLCWLGLLIHTAGLLYRMVLEGRPPVTNLYSSAVFIGWGAAFLGLILERIYRLGLGTATGSFIAFATLIIAHNLSLGGDTMEMMRAVLDSNFWLATHVVTITIGYAAMFVAGLLGALLLLLGVHSRVLTAQMVKSLERLVYGILCFATLFSFIGTILGGIWADQSWGRFWGWDPKENGALLIVLWCAVMLHARWSHLVRERGMAAMAVFGNCVTAFSWFGVNMLGVGLHSYGFMETGFYWLMLFVLTQLLVIGNGLLPLGCWVGLGGGQNAVADRMRRAAMMLSVLLLAAGFLLRFHWFYEVIAALVLAAFLSGVHWLLPAKGGVNREAPAVG